METEMIFEKEKMYRIEFHTEEKIRSNGYRLSQSLYNPNSFFINSPKEPAIAQTILKSHLGKTYIVRGQGLWVNLDEHVYTKVVKKIANIERVPHNNGKNTLSTICDCGAKMVKDSICAGWCSSQKRKQL